MKFKYKALNEKQKAVEGNIEASNKEAAINSLRKLGYRPLSVKKVNQGFNLTIGQPKVKQDEMTIFTRQLSVMISASVPLIGALESLSGKGETVLQKAIKDIISQIEGGATLAESLAKHKNIFDDIYLNMVKAGVSAGILDDILKRLAIQQEKANTIRKKIKSAMAYPTVLIIITISSFFGLMLFVIPKIGTILTDLGGEDAELPAITQTMLNISGFLTSKTNLIVAPIILGLIALLVKYLRSPKGRPKFDKIILKIPGVGPIIRKIVVARFARTFSALMGAGVSVVNALKTTSESVGNEVYRQALTDAVKGVKNGKQLSEILRKQQGIWPDIVVQMVAVGEETGNTEIILTKVADFYEEEVDLAIDQINSIIEPVMIVIMGSMVGVIAASVMSPIASLSKNIQ